MNGEMMKQFENLFIELKKTTLNEMKMIDTSPEKGDEVDLSQEDRQRALDLKLLGRQNFMLKKIDHALLKIKEGTFGICDECDCEIEINRLRARPIATQCISCKEAEEKNEAHVLYEKKSHTLGQTFATNVLPLRRKEDQFLSVVEN